MFNMSTHSTHHKVWQKYENIHRKYSTYVHLFCILYLICVPLIVQARWLVTIQLE